MAWGPVQGCMGSSVCRNCGPAASHASSRRAARAVLEPSGRSDTPGEAAALGHCGPGRLAPSCDRFPLSPHSPTFISSSTLRLSPVLMSCFTEKWGAARRERPRHPPPIFGCPFPLPHTPSLPTPLPACTDFLQIPVWHIPPCPSSPCADVTFTGRIPWPLSPNIPSHPSLLYVSITPADILCNFLVHVVIARPPRLEGKLGEVTDFVSCSTGYISST